MTPVIPPDMSVICPSQLGMATLDSSSGSVHLEVLWLDQHTSCYAPLVVWMADLFNTFLGGQVGGPHVMSHGGHSNQLFKPLRMANHAYT